MLEVLGSRIAGPVFGVSLYIWTALITVTLLALALALGYWLDGRLCDRYASPDIMFSLILAGGLYIAFIRILSSASIASG